MCQKYAASVAYIRSSRYANIDPNQHSGLSRRQKCTAHKLSKGLWRTLSVPRQSMMLVACIVECSNFLGRQDVEHTSTPGKKSYIAVNDHTFRSCQPSVDAMDQVVLLFSDSSGPVNSQPLVECHELKLKMKLQN